MRLLKVSAAACLLLVSCGREAPKGSWGSASSPTVCVTDTCSEQALETESATPVGGVGETLRFQEGDVTVGTVTLIDVRRIASAEGPEAFRVRPPSSGSFLVAEVAVVIEEGSGMATPLTFQARSPDGTTYPSVLGVTVDGMNGTSLAAGERSRGEVAFDVAEGEVLIDYRVSGAPLATFRVVK